MKKIFLIGLVCLMGFTATGCSNNENSVTIDKVVEDEIEVNGEDESYYVTPTDDIVVGEIITIGEIMAFDEETVHIISGDLVQVYKYDMKQTDQFYLNQMVQLIKGETQDTLEAYLVDDFGQRYTNMGHILTSISGVITSISDKAVTVATGSEEMSVTLYAPIPYEKGSNITLYHMTFLEGEKPSLVSIYNEDSKLELKVKAISRSDRGDMVLDLEDADGGAYNISTSNCQLELNISEIIIGDMLTVYHEGIMESWPMQLTTTMIKK